MQPYAQALHAQIRRKFHVRVAVSDHVAALDVDRVERKEVLHHAGLRFAAGAILALEMRTEIDRLEFDALRSEQLQDEAVREIEALLRKTHGPQPVLVRDHDECETCALQF